MEQVLQVLTSVAQKREQRGLLGVAGTPRSTSCRARRCPRSHVKATTKTTTRRAVLLRPGNRGRTWWTSASLGIGRGSLPYTMPVKGGQRVARSGSPLPSGLDERAMRRLSAPSNALGQSWRSMTPAPALGGVGPPMFATRAAWHCTREACASDEAIRVPSRSSASKP